MKGKRKMTKKIKFIIHITYHDDCLMQINRKFLVESYWGKVLVSYWVFMNNEQSPNGCCAQDLSILK